MVYQGEPTKKRELNNSQRSCTKLIGALSEHKNHLQNKDIRMNNEAQTSASSNWSDREDKAKRVASLI